MRTNARVRLVAVFVVVVAGLVAAQLYLRGNGPQRTSALSQQPTRAPEPIAWEDLVSVSVTLPSWPTGADCAHDAVPLEEPTNDPQPRSVVLVATDKGDVDGDGVPETIAIVHCVGARNAATPNAATPNAGAMQAVAFTRDEAGAIVPLGQVTHEEQRMLLGVEVQPNGSVQVDAVDADGHEEWQTFRWSGERFARVV
jgi:hypothetical protein